jgi:hypothetical protein
MTHAKRLAILEQPVVSRPAIKTVYNRLYIGSPFSWEATFGDYDLGDPVGTGGTEQEAIDDLLMSEDL